MIKVTIEVAGKAKDFQTTVFVKPTDQIDTLKYKVHYVKQLLARKMLIYNKKTDTALENYEKTFNDYELKDGAQLILKEANKKTAKLEEEK